VVHLQHLDGVSHDHGLGMPGIGEAKLPGPQVEHADERV
jgi:hypothetical protein